MNISLRGMICDHLSDTYVPGTNGHTSIGTPDLWCLFPCQRPIELSLAPVGKVGSHGFPWLYLYIHVLVLWYWCCYLHYLYCYLLYLLEFVLHVSRRLIYALFLSRCFLKKMHLSRWSWVSCSPVVLCLHSILSLHWDDLFPFIFYYLASISEP